MNPANDFLVMTAFLVGFLLSTIGETEWLNRRTNAGIYSPLFIAFTSNILSISLGYVFSYIVFLVAYFVVHKPTNEISVLSGFLWFAFIVAVASAPLIIIKRLLVKITTFKALTRPWTYAVVAALVFQVSVLVLPLLVAFFA